MHSGTNVFRRSVKIDRKKLDLAGAEETGYQKLDALLPDLRALARKAKELGVNIAGISICKKETGQKNEYVSHIFGYGESHLLLGGAEVLLDTMEEEAISDNPIAALLQALKGRCR